MDRRQRRNSFRSSMSSELYVHLFSYIYTRYTHVSTHTHSRAHVEFAKRVSQRQIYPAGRSRHWLRIGGRSQRKLQAMNGVIKSVLHTATQPHVGNILPCFALRSASAMFRARRRGIVHNVFEVSPAHIGHWRKKKSEHGYCRGGRRERERAAGSQVTYRDVPSPFLSHEIGERTGKQLQVTKLPETQLKLTVVPGLGFRV